MAPRTRENKGKPPWGHTRASVPHSKGFIYRPSTLVTVFIIGNFTRIHWWISIIDPWLHGSYRCSPSKHPFTHRFLLVPWYPFSSLVGYLASSGNFHHWSLTRGFLPCSTPTHYHIMENRTWWCQCSKSSGRPWTCMASFQHYREPQLGLTSNELFTCPSPSTIVGLLYCSYVPPLGNIASSHIWDGSNIHFKMYPNLASYVPCYKAMLPYYTLLGYYTSIGMPASFWKNVYRGTWLEKLIYIDGYWSLREGEVSIGRGHPFIYVITLFINRPSELESLNASVSKLIGSSVAVALKHDSFFPIPIASECGRSLPPIQQLTRLSLLSPFIRALS